MNSIITTTPITLSTLLICLAVSLVLGVLTSLVFMYQCEHSSSYAIALALLPMVVCLVIMLVNGNIGTGIAVAGAFALVRFRSVPGTAREIAAVFTSVAIGLAMGMGFVAISIIFFAFSSSLTLVLTSIHFGAKNRCEKELKITIPENFDYSGLFDDLFEQYAKKVRLHRIRTTNMGTLFELSYYITFPEEEVPKQFLDEIRTRNGNLNVIIDDVIEREMM